MWTRLWTLEQANADVSTVSSCAASDSYTQVTTEEPTHSPAGLGCPLKHGTNIVHQMLLTTSTRLTPEHFRPFIITFKSVPQIFSLAAKLSPNPLWPLVVSLIRTCGGGCWLSWHSHLSLGRPEKYKQLKLHYS